MSSPMAMPSAAARPPAAKAATSAEREGTARGGAIEVGVEVMVMIGYPSSSS